MTPEMAAQLEQLMKLQVPQGAIGGAMQGVQDIQPVPMPQIREQPMMLDGKPVYSAPMPRMPEQPMMLEGKPIYSAPMPTIGRSQNRMTVPEMPAMPGAPAQGPQDKAALIKAIQAKVSALPPNSQEAFKKVFLEELKRAQGQQ